MKPKTWVAEGWAIFDESGPYPTQPFFPSKELAEIEITLLRTEDPVWRARNLKIVPVTARLSIRKPMKGWT